MSKAIIIPAAGFGKRMGEIESKEMLISPQTHEPLINFSLNLAKLVQAKPIVITRETKQNLISHLEQKKIHPQIVGITKEWAHTVLLSKDSWEENNVLILPDVEFSPLGIVKDLFLALQNHELAFATFDVKIPNLWGMVFGQESGIHIAEKPSVNIDEAKAWGIIAFKKDKGEELFTKILESTDDHEYKKVQATYKILKVEKFIDLTRGQL